MCIGSGLFPAAGFVSQGWQPAGREAAGAELRRGHFLPASLPSPVLPYDSWNISWCFVDHSSTLCFDFFSPGQSASWTASVHPNPHLPPAASPLPQPSCIGTFVLPATQPWNLGSSDPSRRLLVTRCVHSSLCTCSEPTLCLPLPSLDPQFIHPFI